jgi:ornithine cyclodeaminase
MGSLKRLAALGIGGRETGVKILVLSARDVHGLLPFGECADVMRGVLGALARGEVHQPLRTVVQPPGAAGLMALMPAYASGEEAAYGLKAICITPGNPAIGMDTHQGGVLLFAAETGEPLALVNASAITEVRTAAVSAVATGLLARPDAAELAVIGNGVQARAHVLALSATRPLSAVRVAGRDPARARVFAAELVGKVAVPVTGCGSVAEAVAGAGIVVTATTSAEPVLCREWLADGAHVNAVGACLPGYREIDTATMAAAALFADRRESMLSEAGDYLFAMREGAIGPADIRAEIGEVLTGAARGRADDHGITLFKSLGIAAEDLAAAAHVYSKAKAQGAGTWAEF